MWLFFVTQYNSSLSSFVPNFRILSQVVAEKFLTEKMSICINKSDRRKNEKLKKEGKMRMSILMFIYTIHFAYLKVHTKFENTGSNRSMRNLWRKFLLERKKNEQIKGLIRKMWLQFCCTIQLTTIKLCTKFHSPKSSSCWEIFDRKKVKIFIGEKEKWTNKGLICNMWLFFSYTVQLITINLFTKFQSHKSSSCWEIFDRKKLKFSLERKKNEQIKGLISNM